MGWLIAVALQLEQLGPWSTPLEVVMLPKQRRQVLSHSDHDGISHVSVG